MRARELFPGYLSPKSLTCILQNALAEDVGEGDITSNALIPEHRQGRGTLVMREDGVVAGVVAAQYTFMLVDPAVECNWVFKDGDHVLEESVIGTVLGPLRSILTAERLALNLLQRMSGIATATASMIEGIPGSKPLVRDTRKTAPGLRLLDKWAVLLGGGVNHRIGLYDRVLIKDNHIEAVGGLAASVRRAAEELPHCLIDVEARTMAEVEEAITVAELIDVLLLDNMTVHKTDGTTDCSRLKQAVDYIDGRIKTEATGRITLKTAPVIATTGVDYLSCGALTHSVRAIDVALNVS